MELAGKNNIKVRGYISCVLGCPYEGEISPEKVNEVTDKLLKMGCYEISLGDTIGKGYPGKSVSFIISLFFFNSLNSFILVFYNIIEQTDTLLDTIKQDKSFIAGHFHNTYDRAIENIVISLSKGISIFDSSVAGLGGCPYAEGASGNVATEDVLFSMEILGCKTGIDLEKIIDIGDSTCQVLGVKNRASVKKEDLKNIDVYKKMLI